MPEVAEYKFTQKELAEILVKQQELHQGIWAVSYNLVLGATNLGPNLIDVVPAAIVQIMNVGLKKVDSVSAVSVDAAVVNPAPSKKKSNKVK